MHHLETLKRVGGTLELREVLLIAGDLPETLHGISVVQLILEVLLKHSLAK